MDNVLRNINVYNQYVNEYMSKFMDLNLYKDSFDLLLETLPMGGKVLELGCGPGNVVKYLSAQRPDLRFLGIDLAPKMVKAATIQNPDAAFRLLDIRDANQIRENFDSVIAAFCIPYLSSDDLPQLFDNMRNLTLEKGMVYVSFMEGEKSGFEKTSFTGDSELYITYFSRDKIEDLMKAYGFTIRRLYEKDYPELDGSITTDLIYIAEKI